MRLRPDHVDWMGKSLYVPGREKGRGTRGRRVPLLPEGLKALRALDQHDGWGPFSTSSVHKSFLVACSHVKQELAAQQAPRERDAHEAETHSREHAAFRAACKRVIKAAAKAGSPVPSLDGVRPYDLRHSFGTAVYRASGDIRATQELLGHSAPALTARYTLGAVDDRLKAAVASVVPPSRSNLAT